MNDWVITPRELELALAEIHRTLDDRYELEIEIYSREATFAVLSREGEHLPELEEEVDAILDAHTTYL